MKKPIAGYILAGCVIYSFFMVWLMPAEFVYGRLKPRLQQDASLSFIGTEGLWHSGRAAGALINNLRVEDLHWQLLPFSLMMGRLTADVGFRIGGHDVAMRVSRGRNSFGLATLTGKMPAVLFVDMLPVNYAIPIEGFVDMQIRKLLFEKNTLRSLEGTVLWNDAATPLVPGVDLGSFSLEISNTSNGIKGVLSDSGGSLAARGNIEISPDGAYSFSGFLGSRDAGKDDLKNALRLLGRMDAAGNIPLSFSGRINLTEL